MQQGTMGKDEYVNIDKRLIALIEQLYNNANSSVYLETT